MDRTTLSDSCIVTLPTIPSDCSSTCCETWTLGRNSFKRLSHTQSYNECGLLNGMFCLPSLCVLQLSVLCPMWTINIFMLESISAKKRLSWVFVVINWTSVTENPCFIAGNVFNGIISNACIATQHFNYYFQYNKSVKVTLLILFNHFYRLAGPLRPTYDRIWTRG